MNRKAFQGGRIDKFLGRNFGKAVFGGLGVFMGVTIGWPLGIAQTIFMTLAFGILFGGMGMLLDAGI